MYDMLGIEREREMEKDELMIKVQKIMEEQKVEVNNDRQKEIYECLDSIDVEQYYKEMQQSQHEKMKEGQKEVREMERMMDVVERYIDAWGTLCL